MKLVLKKSVLFLCAFSLLSINGCSIQQKIDDDKNKVAQYFNDVKVLTAENDDFSRVKVSSKFYVPTLSQKEAAMPDWYFSKIDSAFSAVPFSLIVSQMTSKRGITAKYNELNNLDQAYPITIAFKNEALGVALDSLAKSGGYALSYEGDSVTFHKYQEKTFAIATLPGDFNSQIGNDGEIELSSSSSSDSASGSSASMDAGSRQYSSLSIKDKSIILELKKALLGIKTEEGSIEISELTMSVFVKDRPATVNAIERVINTFNEELTKTVSLDIKLLDVIYTTNNRSAFDYKAIANLIAGKGLLQSSGEAFIAGIGTTPTPSQFDLSVVGGDFDGTQLFIDALKKQADVSRSINVPIEVANGSMTKVMAVDNTMYVAEQYGGNSTTGGVLTGGGARQETLQTGQIINVFARAFNDDVIFKINASISAKLDIKKKIDEASGLYLESPETTAMIFDLTSILESGVTRIITGINSETINVSDSNAGYDFLGFSRTSETMKKETIMIVTARVVRGLKNGSRTSNLRSR
ncbi:MAG: hypothetical protein V7749_00710 [Cocleimonas sp.]